MTRAQPPADRPGPRRTSEPPTGAVDENERVAEDKSTGRSRLGGMWAGLIVAAVLLVLLLIFILQNLETVRVDYLGLSGHLPLGVAILLGVAAGALLVALAGTIRILRLRGTARRH